MAAKKFLWITFVLAMVSPMIEALRGDSDEKLDGFLFHLVQKMGLVKQGISNQCTAAVFGTLDWKSSKFPIVRFGLANDNGASPDVSLCYFVVSAIEAASEALDKDVMKLAAATRRNPIVVVRIHADSSVRADDNTSLAIATDSKARTSTLKFPVIYLKLKSFGFVLTRHCREPRRGVWIATKQIINYKDPDQGSACTLRVAYNNVFVRFIMKPDNTPDLMTQEAHYIQLFLDANGFKGEYINGNNSWGSLDPKTGKVNGVVGMAADGTADVAVSFIGYNPGRGSVTDYSFYVGPGVARFFTRYPDLLSPTGNIAKVFDGYSWLLIFISTILLCFLIYIVAAFSEMSGNAPDFFEVFMNCNVAISAAPDWFNRTKTRQVTLGFLLATVTLTGLIITKAFGCNLNAILLKSESAKPIDDPCDIVDESMKMIYYQSSWRKEYMESSPNPCQNEAAKNYEIMNTGFTDVFYRVAIDPKAVHINTEDVVMGFVIRDPRFQSLPKPWFYWSKTTIQPYYAGWTFTRNSAWKELLNDHILRCHAAGIDIRLDRLVREPFIGREDSLKPMSLEHFVVGFIIMLIGLVVATAAFLIELRQGRKSKATMKTDTRITAPSNSVNTIPKTIENSFSSVNNTK